MTELARRAVACKHWRWMPGMLTSCEGFAPLRLACEVMPYVWWGSDGTPQDGGHCLQGDVLPDLSDPATVGALLALVREAWEDPCICTAVDNTGAGWWVDGWVAARPQLPCDLHDTEAKALVAALEAAP